MAGVVLAAGAPKVNGAGEGEAAGALAPKEKPEVVFVGVLGAAPKENGDALGSSFFSWAEPKENNAGFVAGSAFSGAAPNENGALEVEKVGWGASTAGPPNSDLGGSAAGVEGAVIAPGAKEKGAGVPSGLEGPA